MTPTEAPKDLVGIGIGPANLSLAALADGIRTDGIRTEGIRAEGIRAGGTPVLNTAFYDQHPTFTWHPGLLVDGTKNETPFLADLVTLANPASPWTFLNFLKTRDRLFPFYVSGRLHIHRAEYDAYCHWVADNLPGLHFGHQIDAVRWNPERHLFEVDFTQLDTDGEAEALGRTYTKNVVLGIGTEPHVPDPLKPLVDAPGVPVLHAADYLQHRETLLKAPHVTVVGTGQSGAEIFLDLLRNRPTGHEKIHWLGRTETLAPAERTPLALEQLTPDHTRYFHTLAEAARDHLQTRRADGSGIDPATLTAIHEELYRRTLHGGWPDAVLTPGVSVRTAGRVATTKVELHLEHIRQNTRSRLTTDAVVLATGYRERPLGRILAGLDPYVRRDSAERPRIDAGYRMLLDPSVTGTVHVQNAERHTHGNAGAPLAHTAWRSATILNTLTGANPYPLPHRTAFTTFGLEQPHLPSQPHIPTARQAPAPVLTPLADSR
ncbi:L-lysine 6-monooxygenase (NADPH) [Actinobacteria bacterium OK074]|nr:L-lysine 6-monooxygenase (NADPH) [Actinobacteria bacterium OK074]